MDARRWLLGALLALGCHRGTPPAEPAATPSGHAPMAAEPPEPPADSAAAEAPLRLVEVAPGIYAALQPEARRFDDANAALLVTDAGLVVIDAPQRVLALEWLRAKADALAREHRGASEQPPRLVFATTHWHLDHSLGGSLWRASLRAESVPFEHWGHAGLPPRLAAEGQGQLDELRARREGERERATAMKTRDALDDGTPLTPALRVQLDGERVEIRTELDALAHAKLSPPDHLVAEPTTLTVGTLALDLIPVRAHTEADLVVHLPAAGVLVTGDVLDEIPFGGHGRPRRWLAALKRLRALKPTTIIPGHGPLLGPAHLDRMIALWEALLEQAMLGIQRGETPEARFAAWSTTPEHQALRTALVTDPASERAFADFLPEALARAMADLRGDLDPPPKTR